MSKKELVEIEETNIKMTWQLKTEQLKVVDAMMKKMLRALTKDELELIGDCKITKTVCEVDIDAMAFGEKE